MSKTETENQAVDNVLDYVPLPAARWEMGDDQLIHLLVPKFTNRWLKKYILPRVKHPDVRIHLDDFGTWVWGHMDGTRTLLEIGRAMEAEYGESVKPVYERLGLFVNMLAQRGLVTLQKP